MLLTYLLTYYTPCARFTNNDIAATKAVDSANNYKCTKCHQQAHVGIALLQQNPPVLGYGAGSHKSACTMYGHETNDNNNDNDTQRQSALYTMRPIYG